MRTNGSGKVKVSDEEFSLRDYGYPEICFTDDWIYFFSKKNNGELYKVRYDGTNKQQISNDINSFYYQIAGDWIYYSNLNTKAHLYKVKTDGTVKKELIAEAVDKFVVSDDYIFFFSNYKNIINRTNLEGGERTQLLDAKNIYPKASGGYRIFAVGDWIYFSLLNDGPAELNEFRAMKDGTFSIVQY